MKKRYRQYDQFPREITKKAFAAFRTINQRCTDPRCDSYPYYGAKGIKSELLKKDFVPWYCGKLILFDGNLKDASVGRIDHSKNYTMDNIEVQSVSENSKEMNKRNPHIGLTNIWIAKKAQQRRILISDNKTREPIFITEMMIEAAMLCGAKVANIWAVCNKKKKPKSINKGMFFVEYYD